MCITYWQHYYLWNKSNDYKGSKGIIKKICFSEIILTCIFIIV